MFCATMARKTEEVRESKEKQGKMGMKFKKLIGRDFSLHFSHFCSQPKACIL